MLTSPICSRSVSRVVKRLKPAEYVSLTLSTTTRAAMVGSVGDAAARLGDEPMAAFRVATVKPVSAELILGSWA